jgi:hypothetical protein
LGLRKPNGFFFKSNINFDVAILVLVNKDFAVGHSEGFIIFLIRLPNRLVVCWQHLQVENTLFFQNFAFVTQKNELFR